MENLKLMSDNPENSPESFETALHELENVVSALESGGVPLEKSLQLLQHGLELAKRCETTLAQAELALEKVGDDGGRRVGHGADGEWRGLMTVHWGNYLNHKEHKSHKRAQIVWKHWSNLTRVLRSICVFCALCGLRSFPISMNT